MLKAIKKVETCAKAMVQEGYGRTPIVTTLLAIAAEINNEILDSSDEKKLLYSLMADVWKTSEILD